MVIHIVFWIQRREREPRKLRREGFALHSFPECLRPPYVIVAVKIAAADRRSRKLELVENGTDNEGAYYKLDDANGSFG